MKFIFAMRFVRSMNVTVAFRREMPAGISHIRLAAGNVWRVWLGERMIAYGPMRAAHGETHLWEHDLCLVKPQFEALISSITESVPVIDVNSLLPEISSFFKPVAFVNAKDFKPTFEAETSVITLFESSTTTEDALPPVMATPP